jgi:hypothetical protein
VQNDINVIVALHVATSNRTQVVPFTDPNPIAAIGSEHVGYNHAVVQIPLCCG